MTEYWPKNWKLKLSPAPLPQITNVNSKQQNFIVRNIYTK